MRIENGKVVITDSRGNSSVTLPMVYAAFCMVQFMWVAQLFVSDYSMDGLEWAGCMAAVGGIWLWREGQTRTRDGR